MRRATLSAICGRGAVEISIHALHEESDLREQLDNLAKDISIHALHEESDTHVRNIAYFRVISIHALHEESDLLADRISALSAHFNPRSP